jgi:hypothetical protein
MSVICQLRIPRQGRNYSWLAHRTDSISYSTYLIGCMPIVSRNLIFYKNDN